jgi:uncharacterized membrane protein
MLFIIVINDIRTLRYAIQRQFAVCSQALTLVNKFWISVGLCLIMRNVTSTIMTYSLSISGVRSRVSIPVLSVVLFLLNSVGEGSRFPGSYRSR